MRWAAALWALASAAVPTTVPTMTYRRDDEPDDTAVPHGRPLDGMPSSERNELRDYLDSADPLRRLAERQRLPVDDVARVEAARAKRERRAAKRRGER